MADLENVELVEKTIAFPADVWAEIEKMAEEDPEGRSPEVLVADIVDNAIFEVGPESPTENGAGTEDVMAGEEE